MMADVRDYYAHLPGRKAPPGTGPYAELEELLAKQGAAAQRAEQIHARLLQLSLVIPVAERDLQYLRDERINLTLELKRIRKGG
jgi:hypothetical protein